MGLRFAFAIDPRKSCAVNWSLDTFSPPSGNLLILRNRVVVVLHKRKEACLRVAWNLLLFLHSLAGNPLSCDLYDFRALGDAVFVSLQLPHQKVDSGNAKGFRIGIDSCH